MRKPPQPIRRDRANGYPYNVVRLKRENGPIVNAVDALLEKINLQFIRIR
ncbi:MAG: hypothetical protein M5R36_28695 [Deltaproteobacteria bacterium]|nr:hypothetical protein [Deltaproteobacteria bacterium]